MKYLFLFAIAILFSLSSAEAQSSNNPFPDVNLKTLDGKVVNTSAFTSNGKITIVSFWATWCTPCKIELDAFHEYYEGWAEKYNLQILAITIDDARTFRKVPAEVKSKGWKFDILADVKQELQQMLSFQTIPQTFLLNEKGEIVYAHNGYNAGDELELEKKVAALSGK